MKETSLWTTMAARCPLTMRRVTDRFDEGFPDVLYTCKHSMTGLVELKVIRPGDGNKIKFRPGQPPWLMSWARAGGLGWIFLKHVPYNEYWLLQAQGTVDWMKEIQMPIVEEREILITKRWKGRMDWEDLARILTVRPM